MGDAALEPSLVDVVPALHAGDDDLGKTTTTDARKKQKDIASSISSIASTASDGTKTEQEEAVAGRGEDILEIPFKVFRVFFVKQQAISCCLWLSTDDTFLLLHANRLTPNF